MGVLMQPIGIMVSEEAPIQIVVLEDSEYPAHLEAQSQPELH